MAAEVAAEPAGLGKGMAEKINIASISGGKDSTAMVLHLKEQGIPFRAVHFDTGWEHAATYAYLRDVLPEYTGPIEVHSREPELDERREAMAAELEALLGHRSPFVRWCIKKGGFPGRLRRFCTEQLKVLTARDVMRAEHDAGRLPVNVVGIRADESARRSKMPERELSTTLDCMVWRPLIRWSEQDVINIHKRHNVPPNPLYLQGARRVGCWPCVHARKSDLRMLDESRIQVMEALERTIGILARERRERAGTLDTWEPPAFYQSTKANSAGRYPPLPIRRMVEWGNTARGGRELDRQASLPGMNDGCLRWGMCDLGGN